MIIYYIYKNIFPISIYNHSMTNVYKLTLQYYNLFDNMNFDNNIFAKDNNMII